MLFNSLEFLIFFPFVVGVFFSLSFRFRWIFLLLVSCFFYMVFKPEYILILLISSLIDYFIAIYIPQISLKKKKIFLYLGIFNNLGFLFFFKYFNFFNDSIKSILNNININYNYTTLKIILPLGISYYTFKKISYLVDVYRGNQTPEKQFAFFLLYVTFFPEVIAGPIDRSGTLIGQFKIKRKFEFYEFSSGLQLMLWGFFKKIVIADNLAPFVNKVFYNPQNFEGGDLFIATLFFTFQIYCHFSGYSDIAIGIGRVLGFRLMNNFYNPYHSKNISDFWKRWHISLTTWLRDYLFLPISFWVLRKIKSEKFFYLKAESWAYLIGMLLKRKLLLNLI